MGPWEQTAWNWEVGALTDSYVMVDGDAHHSSVFSRPHSSSTTSSKNPRLPKQGLMDLKCCLLNQFIVAVSHWMGPEEDEIGWNCARDLSQTRQRTS